MNLSSYQQDWLYNLQTPVQNENADAFSKIIKHFKDGNSRTFGQSMGALLIKGPCANCTGHTPGFVLMGAIGSTGIHKLLRQTSITILGEGRPSLLKMLVPVYSVKRKSIMRKSEGHFCDTLYKPWWHRVLPLCCWRPSSGKAHLGGEQLDPILTLPLRSCVPLSTHIMSQSRFSYTVGFLNAPNSSYFKTTEKIPVQCLLSMGSEHVNYLMNATY